MNALVKKLRSEARKSRTTIHYRPYPEMPTVLPCGVSLDEIGAHEFSIQKDLVTCRTCLRKARLGSIANKRTENTRTALEELQFIHERQGNWSQEGRSARIVMRVLRDCASALRGMLSPHQVEISELLKRIGDGGGGGWPGALLLEPTSKKLSKKRRSEIATKAAKARWRKP